MNDDNLLNFRTSSNEYESMMTKLWKKNMLALSKRRKRTFHTLLLRRGHKIHTIFSITCPIWKTFLHKTDKISRDWVIAEATTVLWSFVHRKSRDGKVNIPMRYSFLRLLRTHFRVDIENWLSIGLNLCDSPTITGFPLRCHSTHSLGIHNECLNIKLFLY